MEREIDGEMLNVPSHVAIILDGNGRWAKKRLLPRNMGHKEGAKAVEECCEYAYNLGIEYLTVYAFSTENWKRSVEEVTGIMNLLRNYLLNAIERSNNNNMKVQIIGDKSALAPDIIDAINKLEKATENNTGLKFTIALNYGGRDELRRAMTEIAKDVKAGVINPEDITEEMISKHLDTKNIPDPDLLIRTSGEMRSSNFLPWQISYSEFYFTDVLWPDFSREDMIEAVRHYSKRDRRYGGVK